MNDTIKIVLVDDEIYSGKEFLLLEREASIEVLYEARMEWS
jgi:hypothetical protein